MKHFKSLLKINNVIRYKYMLLLYLLFTFIFLLVRYPSIAADGVKNGLSLCFQSLIPSLYPFLIVVELLLSTGILMKNNKVLDFLSLKIFRLPFSLNIFILSCLGGYPVGVTCVSHLVGRGVLNAEEGEKLLNFTVNPSLSFAVAFVGAMLYKSIKAGFVLYLSVILSSVIIGILSGRKIKINRYTRVMDALEENEADFSTAFTLSVKKSAVTMFYICSFTVLFSSICSLVEILPFSPEINLLIKSATEITNGISLAYKARSLPFIASLMSFGGLSVAFQIFSVQGELKIKSIKYFFVRTVSAVLCYLIATVMLKIFPVTVNTFSPSGVNCGVLTSHSTSVSIGMILMTVIFIADDSITAIKNT